MKYPGENIEREIFCYFMYSLDFVTCVLVSPEVNKLVQMDGVPYMAKDNPLRGLVSIEMGLVEINP